MDEVVKLFNSLILAVLGFVAPITGAFLSVYREGIFKITSQFRAEKENAENNIKKQIEKIKQSEEKEIGADVSEMIKNLKELEVIKKKAEKKLSLLSPGRQLFNLFVPLVISFIATALYFLPDIRINIYLYSGYLFIGIFFFILSIYTIRTLVPIIFEARSFLESEQKEKEIKIIELLSQILENTKEGAQVFLKQIYLMVSDKLIKDDLVTIDIVTEKKENLRISIANSEMQKMAKNIEVGFYFDLNFIIEKKSDYSIYTDEPGKKQIVRYNVDFVHGKTNLIMESITLTALKAGRYTIKTFVKGENVATKYNSFTLNAVG